MMDEVVPGSPSSLSSESTDSDGVNTSSAKIYFGQFRSPERKLAALVDSAASLDPTVLNVSTPGPSSVRRSPRLSSPPALETVCAEATEKGGQEEEDEIEEDENALAENGKSEICGGSWRDAPFPEFLRKDEPSSAIASRIMRAHDNPSPPPKAIRSSLTPRSSSKLGKELVFPEIPSSSESSDAAVESLLRPGNDRSDNFTPPPIELLDISPLPTPTSRRRPSRSPKPCALSNPPSSQATPADAEADLISFDRSVLISPCQDGVGIHSPSPQHAQQLTIDDLLFSSPPQFTLPDQELPMNNEEKNLDLLPGGGLESEERDNIEESMPSIEVPDNETRHPEVKESADVLDVSSESPDRGISQREPNQGEIQTTPVTHLPIPGSSSVPRRSPRLSTRPLPAAQAIPPSSTPGRTPKSKTPNTDGSQSRKRRRDASEKPSRMSLTPRKQEWAVDSDGSTSDMDLSESPSKKGRRIRKRIKKGVEAASNGIDARLAESLSPGSTHILTSLVSSDQLVSTSQVDTDAIDPNTPRRSEPVISTGNTDPTTPVKPSAPPPITSVQRPPPGVFNSYPLTPARGTSTSRSLLGWNSPVKSTLTPAPLDNPNRTPARRIPVRDAYDIPVASHASLGQPSGMRIPSSTSRPPVFSRPPPPNPSPIKRVPISDPASRKPPSRPGSVPASLASSNVTRSKSVSVEPPENGSSSGENKLTANAEVTNVPSVKSVLPGPSSGRVFLASAKESTVLKTSKPAPKAESRIPRPGTAPKPSSSQKSKLPMHSTRKANGLTSLPSRLPSPKKVPISRVARLQNSSSGSSDDSGGGRAGASGGVSSRRALNGTLAKRKRAIEKPAPARPMVKIRQVVPGMFGGPVKTAALNGTERPPENQPSPSSPAKPVVQPRPIRAREVVKGTLQDFEFKTSSFKSLEALSEARAKERAELEKAIKEAKKEPSPAPSLETFTFECAKSEQQEDQMDVDSATAVATTSGSSPPSENVIDMEVESQPYETQSDGPGARRSTRARRSVSTDVFGTVSSTTLPGPTSQRRRSGTGQLKSRASSLPPNLIFSTNGVALKTLTNNNTSRNQHYHAQLEMHIVRKAGERPESPTMKLRTIVEKQKEDQDKMRAERARRRRGPDASDESGDFDMEEHGEMLLSKHRRGPGDEEDYETPVRPNDGRKAVKWDRGLEVSVFLDEIEVHPRKHRVGEGPSKGCLVDLPNRAPLDGLGNPVNADSPLGLAPEKVVVTKFIYDNDEEAPLFDPQPPKSRSKSKKK